jgi:hypothetical protein
MASNLERAFAAMGLTMPTGTRAPGQLGPKVQSLAADLRSATSAEILSARIDALKAALDDAQTQNFVAFVFMAAGGLTAIIRLLRSTATSDPRSSKNSTPSTISFQAGEALSCLLNNVAGHSHVALDKGLVPGLVDALRDAPTDLRRCMAARASEIHGGARPEHLRAMAEAGVVGLAVVAYTEVAELAWETGIAVPILALARILVGSEGIGTRDLIRVMRAPDKHKSFAALMLLYVSTSCCTYSASNTSNTVPHIHYCKY